MLLSKMLFLLFLLKQLMFVTDFLNSLCCLLDIVEEIATQRLLLQDECQRSRYYSAISQHDDLFRLARQETYPLRIPRGYRILLLVLINVSLKQLVLILRQSVRYQCNIINNYILNTSLTSQLFVAAQNIFYLKRALASTSIQPIAREARVDQPGINAHLRSRRRDPVSCRILRWNSMLGGSVFSQLCVVSAGEPYPRKSRKASSCVEDL